VFEVVMPQLGETVADGTLTRWFKGVGDDVAKGEALFEVSTDKVETEVPSPVDGVLSAIVVDEGVTVDVGSVLARIRRPGDDEAEVHAVVQDEPTLDLVGAGGPAPVDAAARSGPTSRSGRPQISPAARRLLEEHHLDASQVRGSGPNGRITRDDVAAAVEQGTPPVIDAGAVPLSPVVRRLLDQHEIDPSTLRGTGPNGRLTRVDVEAAIRTLRDVTDRSDEVIPFSRIRRLTAEHMVRSKATSAHTLMVKEVDYEAIEVVRRAHGAAFKATEGFTLTYLPFNAVAVTEALADFPHLNASVGDGALLVHKDVNLGIAVDVDGQGLVVPVVQHSASHALPGMARRIRDLVTRARAKQLTVDDMRSGTFTISNPGPLGTLMTGAIINQPEVAILATDAVVRRPVVVLGPLGEETFAAHSVGLMALTFDHRVIDGAYAARFLARVEEVLGTRDWSEELAEAR
jgi:pyruvate dehydrogenase E2 component (dihydrolipoamide acetyltransferase)